MNSKIISVAKFNAAYPAPCPFTFGTMPPLQKSKGSLWRPKVLHWKQRWSQTHQVSRDSSGDQCIRAIHQGTTDKQHHCCKLNKNGKCELPGWLLTVTTGDDIVRHSPTVQSFPGFPHPITELGKEETQHINISPCNAYSTMYILKHNTRWSWVKRHSPGPLLIQVGQRKGKIWPNCP